MEKDKYAKPEILMRVKISYSIELDESKEEPSVISNPLTDALRAIQEEESLGAAAEKLKMSYRNLWDRVEEWEKKIGQRLVIRNRGRKTTLSAYGEQILRAESKTVLAHSHELRQFSADLLKNFSELKGKVFSEVLLEGCPDDAVEILRNAALKSDVWLSLRFNSSFEGIHGLVQGRCSLAGFNFPEGSSLKSKIKKAFEGGIDNGRFVLLHFATRIQGIAVAPGNPLGIKSFLDIALKGARFVNRFPGTGTRMLAEELMRMAGLKEADIKGFSNELRSHRNVASKIVSGEADAGLCLENIAYETGADFIPLARETYLLAADREWLESEAGQAFFKFLASEAWKKEASSMKGYDFRDCGKEYKLN